MRNILRAIIRLPIFTMMWVLALVVNLHTSILGLVMIPIMYRYRNTAYADLPSWTRPWSNLEDWEGQPNTFQDSLPKWWVEKEGFGFNSFFRYHAMRNSADGLRSYSALSVNLFDGDLNALTHRYYSFYTPEAVRAAGRRAAGYFTWQGFKAGFKFIILLNDTHHIRVKFGWRIVPRHIEEGFDNSPARRILSEHRSFATGITPYKKG